MARWLKKINGFPTCLRFRGLHLLHYKDARAEPVTLDLPDEQVTDFSLGVAGIVAYSADREIYNVWFSSLWQKASSNFSKWAWLKLPRAGRVSSVSVGRSHVAMVMDDHSVYSAGSNVFGQCGYHENSAEELMFKLVPGAIAKKVVCGLDHTLLLTPTCHVTSCGWSADGQTGVGHYDNVYEPTSLGVENILKLETCADSCFALTKKGEVFAWGNNEYGQLGLITPEKQVSSPVQLDLSELDSAVVSIAAGCGFTGVLTSSGSVYVCGYTVEDPSLCLREGVTVIQPERLCRFRRLATNVPKINSLNAGLNYLVAGVNGNSAVLHYLLIWGHSPCNVGKPPFLKVTVNEQVSGLVYGASDILASLSDKTIFSVFTGRSTNL